VERPHDATQLAKTMLLAGHRHQGYEGGPSLASDHNEITESRDRRTGSKATGDTVSTTAGGSTRSRSTVAIRCFLRCREDGFRAGRALSTQLGFLEEGGGVGPWGQAGLLLQSLAEALVLPPCFAFAAEHDEQRQQRLQRFLVQRFEFQDAPQVTQCRVWRTRTGLDSSAAA